MTVLQPELALDALRLELAVATVFGGREPISDRIRAASVAPDGAPLDALETALADLRDRAHDAAGPVVDGYAAEIAEVRQWRRRCRVRGWPISLAGRYRPVSDGDPEQARILLLTAVLDAYKTDNLDVAVERFEAEVHAASKIDGGVVHGATAAIDVLAELRHLACMRVACEPFVFSTTQTDSVRAAIVVGELRQRAAQHVQCLTGLTRIYGVTR